MDRSASTIEGWESQAQVDDCLAENHLSGIQLNRWRREGLFDRVKQVPARYHGSTVHYPQGTCRQIAAAARLFGVKKRVAYVGRQLWWEGFNVDAKFWRHRMEHAARIADRRIAWIATQDEQAPDGDTLQERMAKSSRTNVIMSRIRGRQSGEALETTFGVILQVATGDFSQFSKVAADKDDETDKDRIVDALDIDAARTDYVLGKRLELVAALPGVLTALSAALARGSLSGTLQGLDHAIFQARDDVRNGLRIAVALYDAMSWIYGPQAFGLRLAAWIGRKQPNQIIQLMILGMAMLRLIPKLLMPSKQITALAEEAEELLRMSLQLRELARTEPRLRKILTPSKIRAALQDQPALNRFMKEIELARGT